ncbi:MAG TPA: adenosylcobinamide-phosphate synthase CbiB [Arenibaculum sp.]|nr:adenosylcobinamide-phosphate synthase CbiB [Arenibaculum sp.]
MTWSDACLVAALALLLDRLLGDPDWLWSRLPHPVAWIGKCIEILEKYMNRPTLSAVLRRRRGVFAMLMLAAGAFIAGGLVTGLLRIWPAGFLLEPVVVAIFLAQGSLVAHVRAVSHALRAGGVEAGRAAVGKIVGRDTRPLDEAGISRAAIESGAENFSDGVVAPLVWYLMLGLPGLLLYKTINTADSMIGHRSERYLAFGWAAARLDDVASFLPARLSMVFIAAAAAFRSISPATVFARAQRDAMLHASPNAGWPESAAAAALGIALGGPRRYGSEVVEGAWLNPEGRRDAGPDDIDSAVRLIDTSWLIMVAALVLMAFATAR